MNETDLAQEQLFKVIDKYVKTLVERGFTREEVKAVLTFSDAAIGDTIALAFGD